MSAFLEALGIGAAQAGVNSIAQVASGWLNKNLVYNSLNGAQREQNAWNAEQAEITRQHNEQMDSTKYQRTVADMQAAGVNPALAMNGGVSTQATSNAQASGQATASYPTAQAGDLTSIMALASTIKKQDAEARKQNAEAEAKEIEIGYLPSYLQLRNEGQELANGLTTADTKKAYKAMDEMEEHIKLMKEQCETEEEKQFLNHMQGVLADANAKQVIALTPVLRAYNEAKTEEARASAALQTVKMLGEQNLLEGGYYQTLVHTVEENYEQARWESSIQEDKAKMARVNTARRTGEIYSNGVQRHIMVRLYEFLDVLGGTVGSMFNYSKGTSSSSSSSHGSSTSYGTSSTTKTKD